LALGLPWSLNSRWADRNGRRRAPPTLYLLQYDFGLEDRSPRDVTRSDRQR